MKRFLFTMLIGMLLVGCGTVQTSSYENFNTSYGNRVVASGAAATAAAAVNTSHYGTTTNNGSRPSNSTCQSSFSQGLLKNGSRTLSDELNREFRNQLQDLFN